VVSHVPLDLANPTNYIAGIRGGELFTAAVPSVIEPGVLQNLHVSS
jgi:hypothetical protein